MFNKTPAVAMIEKQHDALVTLKEFSDLVSNPQKIAEAHEAARAEMQLTDEQKKKYIYSLEFSEKYEALANAYNLRVTELEAAEKAHHDSIESHNKKVEADLAVLSLRHEEQEVRERQLAVDRAKLEEDRIEHDRKYSELHAPIDDEVEQNRKDKAANDAERARLEKLAKKLQKKDEKVLAALAEDTEEEAA